MILTITLNPSVDRTVRVNDLQVGEVNVVDVIRDDPGGKGVNVSRALTAQGFETTAVVVGGGEQAAWLENQLHNQSVKTVMIEIADKVRVNLTIMDEEGRTTKINERGPVLDLKILERVESEIRSRVHGGDWVVLAGRLPQGLPDDTYARLTKAAHESGARVAVDSEGASMVHAITANPDLIKPNIHELSGLVGQNLSTLGDVVAAATSVINQGVGSVLCSMGPDGAIFIKDGATHAEPAAPVSGSTVGAGDTLLAGFLANGADNDALEPAIQWSAAAVRLPGTGVPTTEQAIVEPVRLSTSVDADRRVKEA